MLTYTCFDHRAVSVAISTALLPKRNILKRISPNVIFWYENTYPFQLSVQLYLCKGNHPYSCGYVVVELETCPCLEIQAIWGSFVKILIINAF